jgi:hypothetical protein
MSSDEADHVETRIEQRSGGLVAFVTIQQRVASEFHEYRVGPGLSERRTGSGPLPGPLLPVVLEVPIHVLAGPFARALLQRLIERLGPGAEASPAEGFARPHAVVHQNATARHLLRLRYRVQVVRGFELVGHGGEVLTPSQGSAPRR